VHNIQFSERLLLPVFLAGLFVCCYFCHGELLRLRPDAEDLTGFYLMLSCGGALGAIFVGLIAPYLFRGIYELPLSLVLTAVLATLLRWRESDWLSRALQVSLACLMALVFWSNVVGYHKNTVVLARNFYGSLRVIQAPAPPERLQRVFFHGTIEHGLQYLTPELRSRAATYYAPETGIGILLTQCFPGPKRVGLVGLGVGTIAAYGRPGDTFEFYEINPQVIEIAKTQFTFLRDSRAAISIVEGDARLSLEQEHAPPYDVIVLDAFSGDAIPVHLLTREALSLYLRHLKPGGVLAFHLTNHYLDLSPIVKQLADEIGYQSVLLTNRANEKDNVYASSWHLVTQNQLILGNPVIQAEATPIRSRAGRRPWTDESNNLFEALRFSK
jgi:SAM-dependent methyltransferase